VLARLIAALVSGRSDDDVVTHLFDVEEVRAGDVRRHQDVATPRADAAGCGVEWETGTRMLVLGRLDEQGRVTSDPCSGSMVVPDAARGQDVVWSAVVVGVVGALGMVVVRRLARRPVRG
jgi:hypothetical protein